MIRNPHFRRILSNYLRMCLSLVLGILLIRVLLLFGEGVYAAVALTASSIGVAAMLKETMRGATIPELGISYHSKDAAKFDTAYASALVLSAIAGMFGVLVLGIFLLFLGYFSIDESLQAATAYFILSRMAVTFTSIFLSPVVNMMPITGRMVSYNFWLAMERIAEVSSALAVLYFVNLENSAEILIWFGVSSMISMTIVNISAALYAIGGNRQFVPDFSGVSVSRIREVFSSVGWNGAAVASVNLYLRFDVFAVNIFFGVAGTVIFGLASQLAAYTRQVTMGLITGLDAVVSQKSGNLGNDALKGVAELNRRVFELQSISLCGVGIVLLLHSGFIIQLLFGDRLSNAGEQVPAIAQSFVFLMIGMIARGLSEGWMSILAGSGRIRDYALPVLIGALLNPVLVILCASVLKPESGLLSVSIVFMILNIIFHMIVVPIVTARFLGVGFLEFLSPAFRPALLALVVGIITYLFQANFPGEMLSLIMSISLVGILFGIWFLRSFNRLMAIA